MLRLEKDPNASLDYGWNAGAWLQPGETIVAMAFLFTGGLELDLAQPAAEIVDGVRNGVAVPDGAIVAWLKGGTVADAPAQATCRITTSAGRVDDRTILLRIKER